MYEGRSPLRSSSSLPAPSPCTRYFRARVAMCNAPHRPPLGGVNMECTNGQRQGTAGIANRATRMRRLEIRMMPIRIPYLAGGSIATRFFLQIASRQRADEQTRTALLVMAKDFWCEVKRK